jgi:hypothetical protein
MQGGGLHRTGEPRPREEDTASVRCRLTRVRGRRIRSGVPATRRDIDFDRLVSNAVGYMPAMHWRQRHSVKRSPSAQKKRPCPETRPFSWGQRAGGGCALPWTGRGRRSQRSPGVARRDRGRRRFGNAAATKRHMNSSASVDNKVSDMSAMRFPQVQPAAQKKSPTRESGAKGNVEPWVPQGRERSDATREEEARRRADCDIGGSCLLNNRAGCIFAMHMLHAEAAAIPAETVVERQWTTRRDARCVHSAGGLAPLPAPNSRSVRGGHRRRQHRLRERAGCRSGASCRP